MFKFTDISDKDEGFDPKEHMSSANARSRDRCQQLAVAAGKQAEMHFLSRYTEVRNSPDKLLEFFL